MNVDKNGITFDDGRRLTFPPRPTTPMVVINKAQYARMKKRIKELEAERDTFKAALESIRDGSSTAWYTARKALEGGDA